MCSVPQVCLTLPPVDCSPPGSSVHGIFQARILEWVAISSSNICTHTHIYYIHNCLYWNYLTQDIYLERIQPILLSVHPERIYIYDTFVYGMLKTQLRYSFIWRCFLLAAGLGMLLQRADCQWLCAGSGELGLTVSGHRLSCPVARGVFLDQALNPSPLYCKADS